MHIIERHFAVARLLLVVTSMWLSGCHSDSSSSTDSDPIGVPVCDDATSIAEGFRWLAAWTSSRETGSQNVPVPAPAETTVRNIVRITAGGSAIRLRFYNQDATRPIEIGEAAVGIREGVTGAMLKTNSNHAVTFNCGETSAVIPPNTESFYSDPVSISVANQDDLAVSLYIKGSDNPLEFGSAWNESYKTPNDSGNNVNEATGSSFGLIDEQPFQVPPGTPLVCNGCRSYVLRDVEVLTDEAVGVMTFLGSSSFHGYNTSQNQYLRVSDQISVRMLNEIPYGSRHTVVNRGLGGDTLEAASQNRIGRDIWDTRGVTSVVVWVTNDLMSRNADQIIETYRTVIADAHARGINVFCPTWIPGIQSGLANFDGERAKLNDWILTSNECDGVVDYNGAVEAPGGVTFLPQYNSGDSVHSNDAGHTVWSDMTPIAEWISLPAPVPE